jgi:hypothetical protein
LGGAYFPQNGTFCPPFSQDTTSFKGTCVFLLSENEQKLLCMGRTFTANKPLPLNNSPKQLSVSWESNPARVIAREKKYLVEILKIFILHTNKGNSIQWTSGFTGLLQWDSHGSNTDKCRKSFLLYSSSSPYCSNLKIFIYFYFFIPRVFY